MRLKNLVPLLLLLIDPLTRASPIEDTSIYAVSALEPSHLIKRDSDLFTRLKEKGTKNWNALEKRRQEKCPGDVEYDQAKFAKYWKERIPVNALYNLRSQFARRGVNNGKPLPDNAFLDVEYRSKSSSRPDGTAYDNLHAP